MPDLVTSKTFVDGEKGITATKLNQIISGAVIQPAFYSAKPSSSTLDPTDALLELKASGAYAQITGANLISSVAAQVNPKSVIGDTVAGSGGIVVPRYAAHPDRLWTYNAFDDHFDGSSLNAKWTNTNTAGSTANQTVVNGSFVFLEVWAAGSGAFNNLIQQNLPVGTVWDVRVHLRGFAGNPIVTNLNAGWYFNLGQTTTTGVQVGVYTFPGGVSPYYQATYLWIGAGANFATTIANYLCSGAIPEYFRIQYLASQVTNVYWSLDGNNWSLPQPVSAIQSNFSTGPPTLVQLNAKVSTNSFAQLTSDWIRCIYL